jgi:AraC-like DNA-binding protein
MATPEDIEHERARFLMNQSIAEDDLADWLRANDLDESSFTELMTEEALRRRMQRWALDTKLYGRNRKVIIDQLRLEGRYEAAVTRASRRRLLADAHGTLPWPTDDAALHDLLVKHHLTTGWRAQGSIETVVDDHGFDGSAGFVAAMLDAAAARIEGSRRREKILQIFGVEPSHDDGEEPAEREAVASVHRMLESHQTSAVLLAAVELGVFEHLGSEPTLDELAEKLGCPASLLARLFRALVALELLEEGDRGWRATREGGVLAEDHHDSLAPYARDLRRRSLPAWADLASILRSETTDIREDDIDSDLAFSAATWGLSMDVRAARLIPSDFTGTVIDIGGGLGHVATAIAARAPGASVHLIEQAQVVDHAKTTVAGTGVRVCTFDAFGQTIDIALMTRVLCTLSDDAARDLLVAIRPQLASDGVVHAIDALHDGSLSAGFVDLFNLVRSGGKARTEFEWRQLAESAGFGIVEFRSFAPPFTDIIMRSTSEERDR